MEVKNLPTHVVETLRGVYPELSRRAQADMVGGLAANPYTKATLGNYTSGHARPGRLHLGFSLGATPLEQGTFLPAPRPTYC